MPNFNQSGPDGEGPKTGRCLGKCRANDSLTHQDLDQNQKRDDNVIPGQRRGMGPGGGKGRGVANGGRGMGGQKRGGRGKQ